MDNESESGLSRTVTDKPVLIALLISIIIYVLIAVFVFTSGQSPNIRYPLDSLGNRCGHGRFSDKPFLVYFDFGKCAQYAFSPFKCQSMQVCADHCPGAGLDSSDIKRVLAGSNHSLRQLIPCKYSINKDKMTFAQYTQFAVNGQCARAVQVTNSVLNRCIPVSVIKAQGISNLYRRITLLVGDSGVLRRDFVQILSISGVLLYCSILFSLLCLVLTRCVARITAWVSIFISCGLTFASGLFIIYAIVGKDVRSVLGHRAGIVGSFLSFPILGTSILSSSVFWATLGGLCIVMSIVILAVVMVFRRQIDQATILIEEAAYAISRVPSTTIWPFFDLSVLIAFLCFYLLTCMYFRTLILRQPAKVNSSNVASAHNSLVLFLLQIRIALSWIFVVQSIWHFLYLLGIQKLTYIRLFLHNRMVKVENPVWRRECEKIPFAQLLVCLALTVALNSGSAAIGSVMIASTFILRTVFIILLTACQLVSWSLPRFLRILIFPFDWAARLTRPISSTAYVLVVKDGTNFAASCASIYKFLEERSAQYIIVRIFSSLTLVFIAATGITCSSFIGIALIRGLRRYLLPLSSVANGPLPYSRSYLTLEILWLAAFISVFLCYALVGVYGAAIDVMLVRLLQQLDKLDAKDHETVMGQDRVYKVAKKGDLLPTSSTGENENKSEDGTDTGGKTADNSTPENVADSATVNAGDETAADQSDVSKDSKPEPAPKKGGIRWRR